MFEIVVDCSLRRAWEAQRVVWKEDLQAIAQAKSSALIHSSSGLSTGIGGSFLDAENFDVPYVSFTFMP